MVTLEQGADLGDFGVRRLAAGQLARQGLERLQHHHRVAHLLERRIGDHRAARGAQQHQPLLGEDAHRFAQRRAADAEIERVVAFLDRIARREGAAQDVPAQLQGDLLGQGGVGHFVRFLGSCANRIWYTKNLLSVEVPLVSVSLPLVYHLGEERGRCGKGRHRAAEGRKR